MAAPSPQEPAEKESRSLAEFLESSPPDVPEHIQDLAIESHTVNGVSFPLNRPEIQLHCDSEVCSGLRMYENVSGSNWPDENWKFIFLSIRVATVGKPKKPMLSLCEQVNLRYRIETW